MFLCDVQMCSTMWLSHNKVSKTKRFRPLAAVKILFTLTLWVWILSIETLMSSSSSSPLFEKTLFAASFSMDAQAFQIHHHGRYVVHYCEELFMKKEYLCDVLLSLIFNMLAHKISATIRQMSTTAFNGHADREDFNFRE